MARVCPKCRKLTTDLERFCPECGSQTVDPAAWRAMRLQQAPAKQTQKTEPPISQEELSAKRMKIGLGGLLAFLLFFIAYLAAYLTWLS